MMNLKWSTSVGLDSLVKTGISCCAFPPRIRCVFRNGESLPEWFPNWHSMNGCLLHTSPKCRSLLLCLTAIVSFFLTLACWAVSSPPGASPDDDYHLASSFCANGSREGLCQSSILPSEKYVPSAIISLQECYSSQFSPATCEQTSMANLSGQMSITSRFNSNGLYPPLFYKANGVFADSNLKTFIIKSRIFNATIVITLFILSYLYSNETIRRKIPLILAVCSIPLGLFIFASNNPSSWAIAGLLAFALILMSLGIPLRTAANARKVIPLLLAATAAIGSRPDSAVFLAIIIAGCVLHSRNNFGFLLSKITVCIFGFVALPLIWFLKNQHIMAFAKKGFFDGSYYAPPIDVLNNNIQNLPQLIFGGFGFSFSEIATKTGHLGWFNTPVPPITSMTVFALFIILITKCVRTWTKGQKHAVLFYTGTFIVLSLYAHQINLSVIGQNVQPRYFLIFIYLIFGVSVYNLHKNPFTFTGKVMIVFSLTISHAFALHLLIKRYSVGYGDFGVSLKYGNGWWGLAPASPLTVWITASVSFGIFTYCAASMANLEPSLNEAQSIKVR